MHRKGDGQNEYEKAFEDRLSEQRVRFARVDQSHRCAFNHRTVKTFDYLIYPSDQSCVLVELKGRLFRGQSLAERTGLQTWVLAEDVMAMADWRRRFGRTVADVRAMFVFAYRVEQIAAEYDGLEVYETCGRRYVFLAIRLEDYRACMRPRSAKWKTVACPARDFRSRCFPAERIWLGDQNNHEYHDSNDGPTGSGRPDADTRTGQTPVGHFL